VKATTWASAHHGQVRLRPGAGGGVFTSGSLGAQVGAEPVLRTSITPWRSRCEHGRRPVSASARAGSQPRRAGPAVSARGGFPSAVRAQRPWPGGQRTRRVMHLKRPSSPNEGRGGSLRAARCAPRVVTRRRSRGGLCCTVGNPRREARHGSGLRNRSRSRVGATRCGRRGPWRGCGGSGYGGGASSSSSLSSTCARVSM
jgi:hypothetical protein